MTFPIFIKASRKRINVAKEIATVNRLRQSHERRLASRMIRLFREIGDQAADYFERDRSWDEALDDMPRQLANILLAHYSAVVEEFGKRVDDQKADTPFQFLINRYHEQNTADKVTQITGTTRNLIRRAIQQGDAEGLGVDQIARLIKEKTSGSIGRARAATIARTETHGAASWAQHEMQRERNIPMMKRWVSVGDARTRDHHVRMNGKEVPMDEDFEVYYKGIPYYMSYTHDPRGGAANNINCRCATLYFADEDALFEGAEPVQPPRKLFGETHKDELDFHNASLWEPSERLQKIFEKIPATKGVLWNVTRAYYTPRHKKIAMELNPGDTITDYHKTVWRHEYGHFIDNALGQLGLYRDVGEAYFEGRRSRYASVQLADALLEDRKRYTKKGYDRSKEATRLVEWEIIEDAFGIDVPQQIKDRAYVNQLSTSPNLINSIAEKDLVSEVLGAFDNFQANATSVNRLLKGTSLTYEDLIQISGGSAKDFLKMVQGNRVSEFIEAISSLRTGYAEYRKDPKRSFLFFAQRITRKGLSGGSQEGLMFADLMEAMSNGYVGWGHGYSYLSGGGKVVRGVTDSHTAEVMANYMALVEGPNGAAWRKVLDIFAPETLKEMDKLMDYYANLESDNEYLNF